MVARRGHLQAVDASVDCAPMLGTALAPLNDGVTTKVVAQHFSGAPLPFGLDRPLELRGGKLLGPNRLPSELLLDWQPEILRIVAQTCRRKAAADEPWFTLPPLSLVGDKGVGRGHIARHIARSTGLPFATLDVSGPLGAERLRRVRRDPEVSLPPMPVLVMAASGCANPIVLVTGAENTTAETESILAGMIDPYASERWVDEAMQATIDLSNVSWLIQTTEVDALGPQLQSALRSVELEPRPNSDDPKFRLMALSFLMETLTDLGLEAKDVNRSMMDLAAELSAYRLDHEPAASLYQHVESIILHAVENE